MASVLLKVDGGRCDGGCSAQQGGYSDPAMVAVPPATSGKADAMPMQWMQCPTRWMQYVVTEDAVPMKLDAVYLQWLGGHCSVPECGLQQRCSRCSVLKD